MSFGITDAELMAQIEELRDLPDEEIDQLFDEQTDELWRNLSSTASAPKISG